MRRQTKSMQLPVDFSGQSEHVSKSEGKSLVTTVMIPLGSVLVAVLGLLVQNVPWWVTAIVVFYVVVVALVGLIPASIRAYRALRTRLQRREVARRYFQPVRRFLTVLSPSLEESRADTVFNVWKNAVSLDQVRGQVRPDYAHLWTLQSWLRSIDGRLDNDAKRSFEELCDEIGEVVLQFNRLCEQAHREIETLTINGQLAEHNLRSLKQDWNNARDKHNQTVKMWEDLAKNINHDAGERVCFDHCDLLKTIG